MNNILIEVMLGGEDIIATYYWPAVPSVGDGIWVDGSYYKVLRMQWFDRPGHAEICSVILTVHEV